jgi:hypothetical protein
MEYIKCPNCGSETPSILTRCRNCGERLPKEVVIEETNVPKVRNGFVSFWLWACLIINVLFSIGYFALMFSSKGLWSGTPEPLPLRLFWVLASVAIIVGYWQLISWKKVGFYILSGTALVNGIISFCIAPSMAVLITAIAPIFVLFFVLQIPKNGKSCWEQLS